MRARSVNPAFLEAQQRSTHVQSISTVNLKKKFQAARATATLNLSSCNPPLTATPKEIFQLDAYLEEGEKFWEIEPLRALDLSFNALSALPEEVGNLADLHTLKLRSNKIAGALPERLFAECRQLRHIDCGQNLLTELSEGVGYLQDLKELLLNNNRLASAPASLFLSTSLRVLDLSHNCLETLPGSLSLPLLTTLNLAHNQLRRLPASLSLLTLLETLNLSSNQLTSLPDLRSLKALKSLDCSQNQLAEFPQISSKNLQMLTLSYNRITLIPISFLQQHTELSELLLYNNSIPIVPPEIELLQNLKVLDLSNNDLSDLPANIGYLSRLQAVRLEGNRIKTIRQTLLVKPTNELKTYLRTRGPSLFAADRESESDNNTAASASVAPMNSGTERAKDGVMRRRETDRYRAREGDLPSPDERERERPRDGALSDAVMRALRNVNPTQGLLELQSLSLTNEREIEEILRELACLPSGGAVHTVNLSRNRLRTLPVTLLFNQDTTHANIKALNLAGNRLCEGTDVCAQTLSAAGVERGSCVQSLDLSENALSGQQVDTLSLALSPSLEASLSSLTLSNNPLTHLTGNVNRFYALQKLSLAYCSLTDISLLDLSSAALSALTHLDVSNNRLTSLPVSLTLTPEERLLWRERHATSSTSHNARTQPGVCEPGVKLQFLSLENNSLSEIPLGLGLLPALQTLLVGGNPQRMVRAVLVQQGSQRVIDWLREQCRGREIEKNKERNSVRDSVRERSASSSVSGKYNTTDARESEREAYMPSHTQRDSYSERDVHRERDRERDERSFSSQRQPQGSLPLSQALSQQSHSRSTSRSHYTDADAHPQYGSSERMPRDGGETESRSYRAVRREEDSSYNTPYSTQYSTPYGAPHNAQQYGTSHQSVSRHAQYAPQSSAYTSSSQQSSNALVSSRAMHSAAAQGNNAYLSARNDYASANTSNTAMESRERSRESERPISLRRGQGNTSSIGDLLGGGAADRDSVRGRDRSQRTDTLRTLNSKRLGDYYQR